MKKLNLNVLKKINKVEVNDAVFEKIVYRMNQQKNQFIPLYKVGIAASIIFCLILGEAFLVSNTFQSTKKYSQLNEVSIINNNSLYYE